MGEVILTDGEFVLQVLGVLGALIVACLLLMGIND